MDFLLKVLVVLILAVPIIVAVIFIVWGVNALRVWWAVRRHRTEIEAFFAWFFNEEAGRRRAIVDIGHQDTGTSVFICPDQGPWFFILRRFDAPKRYRSRMWRAEGMSMKQFPPYGTTCNADWFTEGVRAMVRVIDAWPREWLRSGRAFRMTSDVSEALQARAAS